MSTIRSCQDSYKHQVAQQFGRAAATYHTHAQLQRNCAKKLLDLAEPWRSHLPPGTILEIGCGTGFITQSLVQRFPNHSFEITDLSPEMVHFCQTHLSVSSETTIQFKQLDGEQLSDSSPSYAMVVSGFVMQWFRDPVQSLQRLWHVLQPGGLLLVSFPGCRSFPEWKAICQELNVPFTANPLPDPQAILTALPITAQKWQCDEAMVVTRFASAGDFFKGLKAIGTGTNRTGQSLSASQLKQLIRYWDDQYRGTIDVHHHVVLWAIAK